MSVCKTDALAAWRSERVKLPMVPQQRRIERRFPPYQGGALPLDDCGPRCRQKGTRRRSRSGSDPCGRRARRRVQVWTLTMSKSTGANGTAPPVPRSQAWGLMLRARAWTRAHRCTRSAWMWFAWFSGPSALLPWRRRASPAPVIPVAVSSSARTAYSYRGRPNSRTRPQARTHSDDRGVRWRRWARWRYVMP